VIDAESRGHVGRWKADALHRWMTLEEMLTADSNPHRGAWFCPSRHSARAIESAGAVAPGIRSVLLFRGCSAGWPREGRSGLRSFRAGRKSCVRMIPASSRLALRLIS
jgi:hypothetical protein